MTPVSELTAAAATYRVGDTPLHAHVAAWLDDTARDLTIRVAAWEKCGLTAEDVHANAEVLYRYPLAVARAVLAESTVTS